MDTITMIVQEPPYGTEKGWNALRLAQSLLAIETHVNVFLLGDAVGIAKAGQEVPTGYYHLGKMLEQLINKGAEIRACATCCKARGLKEEDLVKGAVIGGMSDLAHWTKESRQVITF